MKLTTRSEYALLALVFLARNYSQEYITTVKIAQAQKIPRKFLEQILLTLKRAHYLRSFQGQHGGYQLAKSPQEINIAEIVRLCDGALAPTESVSQFFYEKTPLEREGKLLRVFKDIRDYAAERLESTTLADVS
jgi:Rrf2 family cysteine metabolism transcriptional repressor